MNMAEEILACIKEEDIKYLESGQISKYIFPKERSKAHKENIPHLITRLFALQINSDNEVFYLIQKRSEERKSFPGFYTDSASGHVVFEKGLEFDDIKRNALRELEEEFGISPNKAEKVKFYRLEKEKDNLTKEIAYIFLVLLENDLKLNPDPEEVEVSKSKFYRKEQLIKLLDKKDAVDYSKKIWSEILDLDLFEYFNLDQGSQKNKEEKKNIALFIGRFNPLHHGHIYVMKNILDDFQVLKIGIGSAQLDHTKNDPFTGDERKKFIEAALKKRGYSSKRYEIHKIPDIFNADKWVNHVVSIVGDFDVVFSNSDWVRKLFENADYEVGRKIVIFKKKFSGSRIRELIRNDKKEWRNLVPNEVIDLMKEYDGIERINTLASNSN
ncbi:MAG: nicotinamide-nucleotide adenylyltransferase [Candidatus Lokiarchaeota archaeon]|nr:nicotinamide-nucleotide adenylyltransferase [Candidatus Lokiarchaeota archaeon]MBD3342516.1 nicotinamide-nucleotide adenylyltransferase [Candidatus Lokiarchaeota archaeon]